MANWDGNEKNNPSFFSFEGIDGAGKTSLIKMISDVLTKEGIDHIVTKEPGGTALGEKVTDMITWTEVDKRMAVLLYAASRLSTINEIIGPAIEAGKIVLCDRFIDSSYVYQNDFRLVRKIHTELVGDFFPDCTFLLDIDPDVAKERTANNNTRRHLSNYDLMSITYFNTIRREYLHNIERESRQFGVGSFRRFEILDSSQPLEVLCNKVIKTIESRNGGNDE